MSFIADIARTEIWVWKTNEKTREKIKTEYLARFKFLKLCIKHKISWQN